MRSIVVILIVMALTAQDLLSEQRVAFETASVRVNRSGESRMSAGRSGSRYSAENTPLRFLIAAALNLDLEAFRLTGGPDWIDAERFDIVAALPEGARPADTTRMLRTLLEERFQLVVRSETRELPIYTLVAARADRKLGPRLTPSTVDCEGLAAKGVSGRSLPLRADGGPTCGAQLGRQAIQAGGQAIASLARMLPQYVGRRVEDRTGLTGTFDFSLQFEQIDRGLRPDATQGDAPDIFTAMQEQLGLKLEPARGPVEIFVIDRVERPTEN